MTHPDSTLADVASPPENASPNWFRRAGLAVLLAIVILSAVGVFGVHSRTATSATGGYTLRVTYPQTARAGLDIAWRAAVHHAGGFPDGLTLAVSEHYFRIFETQGFYPDADSATNDGHFVYFTFDKPRGDTFVLEYDAYIQPGSQLGKSATVKAMVAGRTVVHTTLRTWLVP